MTGNLNILIAFFGGIVSFISPCCLPLVPAYLAQLVGPGVAEALVAGGEQRLVAMGNGQMAAVGGQSTGAPEMTLLQRRTPLWHALAFVAGFGLTFIALGASASMLGYFLKSHQFALARIGGIFLILLGLHYAGLLNIPLFDREGRVQWRPTQRSYPASFVVGIVFALGWTPCIGAILTPILFLATQSGTLASGVILLTAYTLGLGVPFIALGAAFTRVAPLLRRLKPYLGIIERVTGLVIVAMGIIIFFGWLIELNKYFAFPGI